MGVFTQVGEIEQLSNRLGSLVRRRFHEVAKMDAEEIAKELIEEKGLEEICWDIDDAIAEAEEKIDYVADTNVTYDFDNFLLATFDPYPENEEVDDYIVKEIACSENAETFLPKAIQAYAYELWRAGIRRALREILRKMCSEAGYEV